MTIEKIKAEIRSGKCTRIWYSSKTLWWTHSPVDVDEASKVGFELAKKGYQLHLDDPTVSSSMKLKIEGLLKHVDKGGRPPMPMDPTGAPLFQTDRPDIWIGSAVNRAEGFGAHGLVAFMRSHHQNCDGNYFNNWTSYNLLLSK